jgi:hypothetical protein
MNSCRRRPAEKPATNISIAHWSKDNLSSPGVVPQWVIRDRVGASKSGHARPAGDLPAGQQIVGWVERFAKPVAIVRITMGIASLHPSYALHCGA